ncbi:MAG: hypothetical protein Q9186_002161 [Xanthomendoza sp. 1 TL-2023]
MLLLELKKLTPAQNTHGSMDGESLTAYLAQDTNITVSSSSADYLSESVAPNGDIVLYDEKDKYDRLDTAVLFRTTFKVTSPSGDRFIRYITVPRNGFNQIGYMLVERPVPDPDTQFESLAQDKLLDEIPTSLRSAVDPASLIPTPSEDCNPSVANACFLVVDFADLPCPPSAVAKAYDPGAPYFPIIVPLLGVRYKLSMNPDGKMISDYDCGTAAVRDPPVRAIRVGKITGPKDGGDGIV